MIHFAGFKAVGESVAKPLEYYDNNFAGTITLLNVMRKHNCKNVSASCCLPACLAAVQLPHCWDPGLRSLAAACGRAGPGAAAAVAPVLLQQGAPASQRALPCPLLHHATHHHRKPHHHTTLVAQMVFSSSCTVYGLPDKVPLGEDAPIKAISPYGRTKEFQEHMFRWAGVQVAGWQCSAVQQAGACGAGLAGVSGWRVLDAGAWAQALRPDPACVLLTRWCPPHLPQGPGSGRQGVAHPAAALLQPHRCAPLARLRCCHEAPCSRSLRPRAGGARICKAASCSPATAALAGAHPSGELGEHPVGIPNNLMPYIQQVWCHPS